jgi:hypothetical protein
LANRLLTSLAGGIRCTTVEGHQVHAAVRFLASVEIVTSVVVASRGRVRAAIIHVPEWIPVAERRVHVRTAMVVALGVFGGLVAGVVASEVIGVIGFVVFDRAVGIKYLPIYLAGVGGTVALLMRVRSRRRTSIARGSD